MTRTVFGRDPMLIAGAVGGVVALLGSVVFNFTGDQIGAINAVVATVLIAYVSWGTVPGFTAAIIQLIKVAAILAVTFGAHITADQTALVIFAVEGIASAFGRTQVTAIVAEAA